MNCPSVGPVISLLPPSIENAEIESSVQRGLLPAGSAGLKRRTRCVEPHVHALHEVFGHVHVIIFKEGDSATERMVITDIEDFMNKITPRFVRRMSFPREDDLH